MGSGSPAARHLSPPPCDPACPSRPPHKPASSSSLCCQSARLSLPPGSQKGAAVPLSNKGFGPPVTKLHHVPGIRHTAPGYLSHVRSPSHRAHKLILSGKKQVTKLTAMEPDPERDHSDHPHRRPGNPPDGSWPWVRPHTALMAQSQGGEVRSRRAVPCTASTPGTPSRRQSPQPRRKSV